MESETIAEPASEPIVTETADDEAAGELPQDSTDESSHPSANEDAERTPNTEAQIRKPEATEEAETDAVEGDNNATPSTEDMPADDQATFSDDDERDADEKRPLRVLFLSDETGGGHRASAEALGKQFMIQYPGSSVEVCNLWTEAGDRVQKSLVKSYKHMSANPWQWKLFYHVTNTKVVEVIGKNHGKIFCTNSVKARICKFEPDVVISVHPTMNHLARIQTRLHGKELGKHIPFYTVVTDLGSGHSTWFEKEVNKVYVPSDKLYRLAQQREIPNENIVLTGLPIRHGFAIQAKALDGDRTLAASREYISEMRKTLGLIQEEDNTKGSLSTPSSAPIILIMGGGEGIGSLSDIVNQLYATFTLAGQDATLCVVCGRNAALKEELEKRDWFAIVEASLQERIRKRRMRRSLKERMVTAVTNVPPNFCAPNTILCDGSRDLSVSNNSSNSNNKVDGPKSMEQIMAEAGEEGACPDNKPPSKENPMVDSQGPLLMQLITKLPGMTEKKPTQQPAENDSAAQSTDDDDAVVPLADSLVKDDETDDDDDDEEGVGLNHHPIPASPHNLPSPTRGNVCGRVNVVGLGFVTNMEEYMVAADVLVSKAGPGTIAEAASVGLPIMMTSFLPGQEAGNVHVVLEAGFGDYCEDPPEIAARVCNWLKDDSTLPLMNEKAHKAGRPHAADDIVADIGSETVTWLKMNERWKGDPIYDPIIEYGHTLILNSYLHDKAEVATLAATSSSNSLVDMARALRGLKTAAGVGVGAAVGAVVAGPLLPIGLVVGSAVFPAMPVGLVVGGAVSGLAANRMGKESTTATPPPPPPSSIEGEAASKEEKKEERDDEISKSSPFSFGWGSNLNPTTSPAEADVKSSNSEIKKANWFAWGKSKRSVEAADADESLASSTEAEAPAVVASM